jgi:hypothetical protein
MKRTLEKSFVEVENENPVGQFRMLVNEKSFSIIISGIYSRKIEAIVREYSCNCIDSHKMAGHNKPFDIHLPTYNKPTFYVQDYGVGLDEEDIITVFTVAFASTKDNSNNTTGMLGIGGMSGFCYNTKSFTVTSCKNGKKYIYHCFIGDGGVPSYTKLLEEDTTEQNGVKVEMPVSSGDFYAFEEAAEKVCQWLEIKPNFVGENKLTIDPIKKIISGDGWSVTNNIHGCHLLMGGVLYAVEEGDTALSKYKDHIYSNVLIEAPMGSVDFQPSRERLQYTPKTVSFLRKTFLKLSQEVADIFTDKIKGCKSLWSARNTFQKLRIDLPISLIKLVDISSVEWNGLKLFSRSISDFDLAAYKDDFDMRNFEGISWRSSAKEFGWRKVSASGRTYLCLCDTKKGHIGKVKFRCGGTTDFVHLFIPQEGKTLDDVKTILIKELGCCEDDFILSSTLEEPPKRTGSRSRGKLGKISKWKSDYRVTYSWLEADLEDEDIEEDTYYYVERKGYNYIDKTSGLERAPDQLTNSQRFLSGITSRANNIYGVSTKEIDNLPDNWVEFTKEVSERLEDKKDEVQKYLNELYIYNYIQRYLRDNKSKIDLFKALKNKLDASHVGVIWLNNLDILGKTKQPKEPNNYYFVSSVFSLEAAESKIDFMDGFLKKYPLLDVYNSNTYRYSSQNNYQPLVFLPYILGVDANG